MKKQTTQEQELPTCPPAPKRNPQRRLLKIVKSNNRRCMVYLNNCPGEKSPFKVYMTNQDAGHKITDRVLVGAYANVADAEAVVDDKIRLYEETSQAHSTHTMLSRQEAMSSIAESMARLQVSSAFTPAASQPAPKNNNDTQHGLNK